MRVEVYSRGKGLKRKGGRLRAALVAPLLPPSTVIMILQSYFIPNDSKVIAYIIRNESFHNLQHFQMGSPEK